MDVTKPRILSEVQEPEAVASESTEVTALIERAKSGDAEAFGSLMCLYERRIIALGRQMGLSLEDSQDSCQDAFVKVFRYIHSFRTGHSFYRWLYRIAIRVIYDHLRRRRRSGTVSIEDLGPSQVGRIRATGPSLERRVETADLAGKLLSGLQSLSRRERIVFVLRDLQEMRTGEIAAILRLSPVTVRRHCMLARHKLRQRMFRRDH